MSLLVIHLLAIRAREISAITAEAGDLVIWHSHGERSVIPGWAIWHADTCKKWQEMLAVDGIDEAAYALAGPREIDLYPMKWRGIVVPLAGSLCRIETVDGHVHEFSARNSNLRTTVLTLEIVQAETQRHLERKAEEARQEQLRTVPEVRRLVLINGANLTHGVNAQARISGEASNARRVDSEDNVALWEGERGEERGVRGERGGFTDVKGFTANPEEYKMTRIVSQINEIAERRQTAYIEHELTSSDMLEKVITPELKRKCKAQLIRRKARRFAFGIALLVVAFFLFQLFADMAWHLWSLDKW